MPIEVLMPALSPTMTEGTLSSWVKQEGDTVSAGDVIAEIETDKATMEVEAVDEGTLGKILVEEGTENVAVNKVIALLLEEGEDKAALENYSPANDDAEAESKGDTAADSEPEATEEQDDDAVEEASPAVVPDGVIEVLMPALSPTMTEGNLANWVKQEGDTVSAGDVIAEIETDKATMEVEAVDEGTLGKILIEAGTNEVKVNTPIALLLAEGADKKLLDEYRPAKAGTKKKAKQGQAEGKAEKPAPKAPEPKSASVAPQATKAPEPKATGQQPQQLNDIRVKASPLARRLAAEQGVNLAAIRGTGPKGRIIAADVEDAARYGASGSAGAIRRDPAEFTTIKNSGMRKTIAKRLVESKQQVPHFYLTIDCEIDELLNVRKQLNDKAAAKTGEGDNPAYKVSVNDMVIKAVALALKDVPAANTSWYDDAIVQYTNVDVSVAVAIEGGLVTPVIKNADQKGLPAISNEMKALAKKARDGKLLPEEMQGGGFSVSNLGMFGIKHFGAIINPPQSCILAVGAGEQTIVAKNGQPAVATVMHTTLSVDHRSVDGAVGAEFLQAFKGYIEAPVTMLV